MSEIGSIRNRGIFFGLVALLIAFWFLRMAFRLTGAALRIILIVAVIFLALAWVSSKVGKGTRR
jgi:hypothetical protein